MSNQSPDNKNVLAFTRSSADNSLSEQPLVGQKITVKDIQLNYVDQGEGDPIVFLHGFASSVYTWRNIIPTLANHGRCIAVDFPGMGESEALRNITPHSYHFRELGEYFDLFLKKLDIKGRVTLVMQDLSSVIGCDWAYRNSQLVKGVVHSGGVFLDATALHGGSAVVHGEYPESELQRFIMETPGFMSELAPLAVNRQLSRLEIEHYGRRFKADRENRLPVQRWLSFVPEPGVVLDSSPHIACYTSWMKYSDTPKLWLRSGATAIAMPHWDNVARTFSSQLEVSLDSNYYLTEDRPLEFADAIGNWLGGL